jgi:NADH:ubiquinone oxidoreductase subunit E
LAVESANDKSEVNMLPSQHYRQPDAGAVLTALHDITARCGYLPAEEVRRAAQELGAPLAQVYSAATFYAAFTFKPCGRHKIQVCEGTACYVKGASALMAELQTQLGVQPDETTDDLAFTLKRVRCVGSCGLAPVVRVDNDTHGRLTPSALEAILTKYR